jgi:hypothetical protein
MDSAKFGAGSLIEEIDAGRLCPQRHAVSRALLEQATTKGSDEEELIRLFDAGAHIDRDYWAAKLWHRIEELSFTAQSSLRLCIGLLQANDCLDWHDAEYYILFGRQLGLSERQIELAFRARPQPNS